MKESAPKGGAGSDKPAGPGLWQVRPEGHLGMGGVRTGSSNADANQLFHRSRVSSSCSISMADSARSQSERGLDSAERSPSGEPEARASGKSGAARSDRRETCGGAVAVAVCNLPTTPPFAPNGFVSGRSEGSIAIIGGECDVCN
jgi:hypothetical protein